MAGCVRALAGDESLTSSPAFHEFVLTGWRSRNDKPMIACYLQKWRDWSKGFCVKVLLTNVLLSARICTLSQAEGNHSDIQEPHGFHQLDESLH